MKTPAIIHTFPIIIASMFVAPAALAVQTDCDEEEAEAGWTALLARHPGNRDLRDLYQLRRRLCREVEEDRLPLEEASERFERARQRLMEKWQERNEQRPAPMTGAG